MVERTNAQWLADLAADHTPEQADALGALRLRLQRGIFYYLSRERSDLGDRSPAELEAMAEDFVQEAIWRILKSLHQFRGDSQFTTWATKVAVRVVISELRRARYRDFSLEDLTLDGELVPGYRASMDTPQPPGPEQSTERADVMRTIAGAMSGALTERQRIALEAVAVHGIPMEIVAERLGTNRNALYKLLHDARSRMRDILQKEGFSFDYMHDLFE
jgi:RNA polymerase sigma-70 factor (ECF subfamily)